MSRLALVTGGSGGIGFELARCFARGGYDVALAARTQSALETAASQISSEFGVNVKTMAIDLTGDGAATALFERFPRCDVLVNNAGFANNGRFASIDESALLSEMHVNMVALTRLTRLYLPEMLARRDGKILNIASTAAFLPGPFMAVYYATKAYVLSFSEALAEELRGSGVTVTCLCPGATATGFQTRANVGSTMLMRFGLADAARVARAGFEGTMRGKPVVIPGVTNKIVAFSPRISPRRMLLWMSRKAVER